MGKLNDDRVFEILKKISEQNVKPHMVFKVLKLHEDGNLHRGIELVSQGYDPTEVYSTIELLVGKGDLTRHGKKTRITEKGKRVLRYIYEMIHLAEKIVIE